MEDQNENSSLEDQNDSIDYSKTARKAFYTMLAGPAVLLVWSLIFPIVSKTSTVAGDIVFLIFALIIAGIAFFLPLAGLINAIRSLWHKDELDKTGRALAIITCVMCNPLFYFFYFFVCLAGGISGEIVLSGAFSM
jgi:threonine/homoserine/homoserine lactone efflux protein